MKATTIIALAAGFTASLVSAQGLDTIPQCALSCALKSLGSTSCDPSNIACICQATEFITELVPCVQGACDAASFQDTVVAAGALCQAAGVTLSVPTAAPTSAPTSSVASSVVVSVTTSVTSMVTSVVSNTTTTATSPAPTGNGTVTQPPAPSGTDGSGAGRNAVALGGLGAVVALVAALL